MTDEQDSDRRRHHRMPVLLRVDYDTPDGPAVDHLTSLASGGLFLQTSAPFDLGDRVILTLSLPGVLEPCPLVGTVRRRQTEAGGDSAGPGVGVEFLFRSYEEREQVARFVAMLEDLERE
ncbi:PilZ domain-containing protein [Planctomycetota bacterium]